MTPEHSTDPIKQAEQAMQTRSRRQMRYLVVYTLLLLLVIGYIWYNRNSAESTAPPAPAPEQADAARFELKAPKPAKAQRVETVNEKTDEHTLDANTAPTGPEVPTDAE